MAGSTAAWMYWINNAYWIPSVYLIFAGTFSQMFLKTHSPWQEAGIAIVLTWITVAIGVVRLEVSKWVPNLGAVVKALIFVALGVLGLSAFLRGRPSSTAFSIRNLAPKWNDTLAYLPALLYSTFGFELMSSAGGEMKNPKRDVPTVILWSGAVIALLYSFATGGVLFAVPAEKLSDRDGDLGRARHSRQGVGPRRGTRSSSSGSGFPVRLRRQRRDLEPRSKPGGGRSRGRRFAEALGRWHARFHTPAFAFVAKRFPLDRSGRQRVVSRSREHFWMTFRLTALCLLLSYLLVFPAFLVLRKRRPEQPRPYRLPGGPVAAAVASWVCTLYIFGACVLFFVPSPTSQSPWKEGLILGGGGLIGGG